MGNLGVRIILVYSLSIQRRLEEVFLELKGESEYILEPEVRMSLNPVNWTLHKFLRSKYLWGSPSEGIRRPMGLGSGME
jgi:hypothetical protein